MQLRFDRGTLVLDPTHGAPEHERFPELVWDPRTGSWRAPASALAALRGRRPDVVVRTSDRPRLVGRDLPPLRWYQREALAAWGAAGERGVVALPTGAGKTIVGAAAIASLGVPALCLVPTRVLLEQWAEALAAWFPDVGRIGDGERLITPLTVATYASAVAWAPRIGDRFGLVVVDEVHHVGGRCPVEVLEMLTARARLGLTATPPGGDGAVSIAHHLGPTVYALGLDQLVGDALASFDIITIPVRLDAVERARYVAARATFSAAYQAFQRASPGATWEAFTRAALRSDGGREALAAWRASRALLAYPADKRRILRELLVRHAEGRVLVFTQDTTTAYAIARELLVHPITHEIGRRERALALERFAAGTARVLVSAQVLDEGLDVPAADVAIIIGGSASARRHVQRIGRVLRPAPGKHARVYELTVQDTVEERQAERRRAGVGRAEGCP